MDANIFFSNLFAIATKSSHIAQIIRKESSLFDLLIESKHTNEFLNVDYKTFADVLIQETARNDLNNLYPNLGQKLLGEESNTFQNKLNVSIEVKVCENISMTKASIMEVVDNHDKLAESLATIIHKSVSEFVDVNFNDKLNTLAGKQLSVEDIEMWIDPIDSTKDYINGVGLNNLANLSVDTDSIRNATVLLGVYDKSNGVPIAGVICQPFHHIDTEGLWCHTQFWGICLDGIRVTSNNVKKRSIERPGLVITSYREVDCLTGLLNRMGNPDRWTVSGRSGAGFKLLMLLTGDIDCCLITKGSTYKWDTCAAHAILRSIGGGLVDYQSIMSIKFISDYEIENALIDYQVRYNDIGSNAANSGGLIAYTDPSVAIAVFKSMLD